MDYTQGGDLDLACHYDNAEVTINICLGKSFTGGSLCFGPMRGVSLILIFPMSYDSYITP